MFESKIKGKLLSQILQFCCGLAFCMYGYDAGVLGGVQGTKPYLDALGNPTGQYIIPMIASAYTLAAAVCAIAMMFVGLPFGRRNCVLLGDGLIIVGGIIQSTAFSVPHIIVGRVIAGFGIGCVSSTVPMYLAEMSTEAKERGPQVAVTCALLISGVALAYWIDLGFTQLDSQVSWRFPIGFQAIFALCSAAGIFFLPDTPRWYYAMDRYSEGDAVLMRIYDLPLEHPKLQSTKIEMLASIALENEPKNKFQWHTLIWDNSRLKAGRRIRISFAVLSLQQLMGINMLVYYATIIFSNVGLSDFLSSVLAAVLMTIFAAGTYFTPSTIERIGRRPIMLWTAVVCTICITIFTILIALPNQSKATQWTAIAFLLVYIFSLGYGWEGCAWLYGPEIAPLKYRHLGGAAGAFGQWLFTFITVFGGGIGITASGWKIWLMPVICSAFTVGFVYFMCPETKGKTLEEIDLLFTGEGAFADASEEMAKSDIEGNVVMQEKLSL
ncbi:hypothetical protein B7463_g1442, partial [Scytalidium lignicola]